MWNSQAGNVWQLNASPLELLIARATSAHLPEPNYALHLEVAEYINSKKANNPRDAAMTIVRLVNNRNPHVSMLALALLETLANHCGYPFQLQVSTKEFLNELVRRFPERPPPFPGPVMTRILELIHHWKETICQDSRWKDDFGNIRDMHRLLQFKGYRFRDFPGRNQNVTPPAAANLKSAEELENEDREAQSAKLQELIRRGTPRDLAAAQELMKSLAGANPDAKPDYKTQVLNELNKLEQKVVLLNEMLDNVDTERGEKFAPGDVYDQVSAILIASRPKIQKWISDANESEDSESLDTYLQINDQINTVVERYEAFQKGDYAAAKNPIPAEYATGSSSSAGLNLIDFDESDAAAQAASAGGSNTDDLMSLFGPSSTSTAPAPAPAAPSMPPNLLAGFNQQAPPSYNYGAPPAQQQPQTTYAQPRPGFPGGIQNAASPVGSSASRPQSAQFGSIMLPGTPSGGASSRMASPPTNAPTWGGMSPPQQASSPFGGMQQPQQQSFAPMQPAASTPTPAAATSPAPAQGGKKDPFADLVGLF
ncbi:VHS-domain-containing protein [Peniophora sp. CONT]|nr:VHS-domain-containing protein [Peniophora sp. CONT]